MHESALFRDLRAQFDQIAEIQHVSRLLEVRIWVGALSHVTESHLREEWPELVHGTAAEGSRLALEVSSDPSHPQASSLILSSVVVPEPEAT